MNFNLPLEYEQLSQYFDMRNIQADTIKKNLLLADLLKKYDCKNIVDLSCGTGSQVFALHELGFNIVGFDISERLIEIARMKANDKANSATSRVTNSETNGNANELEVSFFQGDMCDVQAGKFDAAITIFNAIGHLNKTQFSKALKNIKQNLHSKGIYIFDIFNAEAMNESVIADLFYYVDKKVDNTHVHIVQASTFDQSTNLLTSYDQYFIQNGCDMPKSFKNVFTLQLYSVDELRIMLTQAGFEMIEVLDFNNAIFENEKTLSMVIVARKCD